MGVDQNGGVAWREKGEVRPKDALAYALAVALVLVGAFVYVYPSLAATHLMYDYSDRIRELEQARELNKKLRLEIAALRSYDFIERRAVEGLGFVRPRPEQVVIIAKKREEQAAQRR
ncbi:MAG: cell division protein FtsL [Nitrospinae bacterium]|nr:cell division protein FtsL [Nitrospinota bacterium]